MEKHTMKWKFFHMKIPFSELSKFQRFAFWNGFNDFLSIFLFVCNANILMYRVCWLKEFTNNSSWICYLYVHNVFVVFRMCSESFFWSLGHEFTDHKLHLSRATGLRRFKNYYGVSPNICNIIWKLIEANVPESCEPKHLLWTLCFL